MNKHSLSSGMRLAVLFAASLWAGSAIAQEGVRLSALPSAEMSRGLKPLPPARGFNAANARAAALAPQRRMVTRTVAVTRTQLLPAPGAGSSQAEMLQYRASGLRIIGAASLDNLRNVLTGDEQRAAGGLLDTKSVVEARQLSRFIGQTTQYVSVQGDRALVGWWHPLDDAWIISRWTNGSGSWRIASMGALLGADLAANPIAANEAAAFDWARSAEPLHAAIARQNAAGVSNFMAATQTGKIDGQLDAADRQARAWRTIRERRAIQENFLARTADLPGFKHIRGIVNATVASGGQKLALDKMDAQRIAALPANARATLRAIMVKRRPSGATFVVQSPLAPAFVVLVYAQNPQPDLKGKYADGTVKPAAYLAMSLLGELPR